MSGLIISRHAEARMRQRGWHKSDVELVLRYGSPDGKDVYFLSRKDAELAIHAHKREIERIERAVGSKVVLASNTIVTVYKSGRND